MAVLVVVLALVWVTGTKALGPSTFHLSSHDLVLATIAGLAHLLGVGAIYWALARGPAAVVAPITAVLAASLPVTIGLLRLGVPGPVISIGLVLAVVASVLLSGPGREHTTRQVLGVAVLAGIGFAIQPAALGSVHDPGVPVVFVSEFVSLIVIAGLLVRARIPVGGYNRLLIACGTSRVMGTLVFTLAAGHDLRTAAAVSSLYPAGTVILARTVDKEHLGKIQIVGVTTALIALVLIAIGT